MEELQRLNMPASQEELLEYSDEQLDEFLRDMRLVRALCLNWHEIAVLERIRRQKEGDHGTR